MSDQPYERPAGFEENPTPDRGAAPAGDGAGLNPADEKNIWAGRSSWKDSAHWLLGWAILAIVVVVAGLWLRSQFESLRAPWVGWVMVALIVLPGIYVGIKVLVRIYGVRYRLTNQRLFIDRGILSRTTDQTELIRVDDVRIYRSLFERIFGIGTIEVVSTDATDAKLRIQGIENPDQIAEHIRKNMRTLRKKSIYMEQI